MHYDIQLLLGDFPTSDVSPLVVGTDSRSSTSLLSLLDCIVEIAEIPHGEHCWSFTNNKLLCI